MDANELFNPKKDPKLGDQAGGKKSGGLFSSGKKLPEIKGPDFVSVSTEVNNVSRRLRTLEERYLNLRKKYYSSPYTID